VSVSPGPSNTPPPAARGRGAGVNPGNRFEDVHLEVLPETIEEQAREHPDGVQVETVLYDDATRRIINRVDSPDLPFHWTINPYRGCEHGCAYCYARPTHENLGFSCGLDFETRIVVKRDAPALLRKELASRKWRGEPIVMSGVTDPYQPVERRLRITRGCLEVMAEANQPVSLVTKNGLIARDVDVLGALASINAARVAVSVTTLDPALARIMEPRTSSPAGRLRTIEALSSAGIPVQAMVAPVIPGVNDREIPAILRAVADAGAMNAAWVMLRLPHGVKDVFLDWLKRHFPDRRAKVERFVREMRGGGLYDASFGTRHRGRGAMAEQIRSVFETFRAKFGLTGEIPPLDSSRFRRPSVDGQGVLFE